MTKTTTGNQPKQGSHLPEGSLGWAEREKLIVSPAHYTQGGIETWDFIFEKGLTFDEGNVIKYIVRHKDKNGLEDIRKAIQYAKHIAKTAYNTEL